MRRIGVMLFTALLLMGASCPAPAQNVTTDVLFGGREFSDGTGMVALEPRAGIAPRGWIVRPALGLAGATDFLGSQLEVMLGDQADIRTGRFTPFLAGQVSRTCRRRVGSGTVGVAPAPICMAGSS